MSRVLGISRQAVWVRWKKGQIAWKQTRFYRLYDLKSVKRKT
jgi:biotin operon repressor